MEIHLRHIVFVVLLYLVSPLLANDLAHVSATYEYISDNRNETAEQAKMRAVQRAKEKALEEKFGVDVSRVVTTYQRNTQTGEHVSTEDDFFAIGGSYLRGEWVETLQEKVLDERYEKSFWYVKVYVEGKARVKKNESVEINAVLVNNRHDRVSRSMFYDGDDIFLKFSTPIDGYLCVYLVDENKMAYCLLPTANNGEGVQRVNANVEYEFLEEYSLNTQREVVQNVVYVIFSPNRFIKANDTQGGLNFREEQLPRELPFKNFLNWLARNQTKDVQMVVKQDVIMIRK